MFAWIASILSILGTLLNIYKNIWCWPMWIIGCAIWLCIFTYEHKWAEVTMFSVYMILNITGWYRWHRSNLKRPEVLAEPYKVQDAKIEAVDSFD